MTVADGVVPVRESVLETPEDQDEIPQKGDPLDTGAELSIDRTALYHATQSAHSISEVRIPRR